MLFLTYTAQSWDCTKDGVWIRERAVFIWPCHNASHMSPTASAAACIAWYSNGALFGKVFYVSFISSCLLCFFQVCWEIRLRYVFFVVPSTQKVTDNGWFLHLEPYGKWVQSYYFSCYWYCLVSRSILTYNMKKMNNVSSVDSRSVTIYQTIDVL